MSTVSPVKATASWPSGFAGAIDYARESDPDRLHGRLEGAMDLCDSATVVLPGIGICHRGCSVHQTHDTLCVFEGRLANHDVLARCFGCDRRATAAEIVCVGFARLGAPAIEGLRGEFVLVVWDVHRRAGLIARDQLGARGLFMKAAGSRLVFATEVKWLLKLLPSRPAVDRVALTNWFVLGSALHGRTLYEGVRRMTPGSMLLADRNGSIERTYWRPKYVPPLSVSRHQAAAELRSQIERTAASLIEGSDRIGVLLSGGLDSGIVAAAANAVLAQETRSVVAYSMTFPHHPTVDESTLIRAVSTHLRIPTVEMRVGGGSLLRGGLEFTGTWELPSTVPNTAYHLALLERAGRDGVELMLDGEGGDELFGAEPFLPAALLRRGNILGAWRLCQQVPGFGHDPPFRRVKLAFEILALRGAMPYRLHALRRSRRSPDELAPDWFAHPSARNFIRSYDHWGWKRNPGPLWWSHLAHTLCAGREELSSYDSLRQIGGLAGVERRHPLLDVEVVELLLRLPPHYAYDPIFDRALARESAKGHLPTAVTERTGKSEFSPVAREALFGADLPLVRRLLEAPDAEIRSYVKPELISRYLDAARTGNEPRGFVIHAWRLIMAECWLRSQADEGFISTLIADSRLEAPTVEFAISD